MANSDVNLKVTVTGLEQLKKELMSVAPDLKNELLKGFRTKANEVAGLAKGRIPPFQPMSGWRTKPAAKGRTRGGAGWPAWDPSRAQSGIIVRAGVRDTSGRGYSFGYRVVNASASGVIFELAGRRAGGKQGLSNNPNAGKQFIDNLNAGHGRAGRAIWQAYDALAATIQADTFSTLESVTAEYERRLNGIVR